MLRTLGIWIIAAAAVTSVALQVDERSDREELMSEQRYQSCMTHQIGGVAHFTLVNEEELANNQRSIFVRPQGGRSSERFAEAMLACTRRHSHTTAPTTTTQR